MFDLAIKRKVPADELSALEIECNQIPVSVAQAQDEVVPDNDYHPRPILTHPIDTNGPNIPQLQVIVGASTLINVVNEDSTAKAGLHQPPNLPTVTAEGLDSYDSIVEQ